MQARYRREVDGNYLELSDQDFREKEYTLQMLRNNQPESFLRLRISNLNGQPVLLYEVTSMQPVSRFFERSGVGEKQLRMMLDGLEDVQKEARRFLLSVSDIVLDPDYIFYDQDRKRVRFLYAPQYGLKGEGSLKSLAEFLLRHLDHKDAAAVALGYALYDKCTDAAANLSWILEELEGEVKREDPETGQDEEGSKTIPSFGRERIMQSSIRRERTGTDSGRQSYGECARSAVSPNKEEQEALGKEERKKRGFFIWKKEDLKGILLITGISLGSSILFALTVWFGKLDLTQTGGLFFGMIALVWLIYRVAIGNRKEKEDIWAGELEDPDEEEAYLEALMTDVYSKEPGRRIPLTGMEGALSGIGPDFFHAEDVTKAEYREAKRAGLDGRAGANPGTAFAGTVEEAGEQASAGYTRVLGYAFTQKKLWLISEDMRRSRDLLIEGGTVRIGKKPDQVDLCIPLDVISRVHAQIRQTADGAYLQDLNSTNGTSINGQLMEPSQEQPIQEGDRISFAGVRFTVHFKEDGKTS